MASLAMPDPVAIERRNRIRLAVAAYAYEVMDDPVMTDAAYDRLSRQISPNMVTGNVEMDVFFRQHFDPSTGAWVRKHPNKNALALILAAYGDKIRRNLAP
jgi:hypothetical protein